MCPFDHVMTFSVSGQESDSFRTCFVPLAGGRQQCGDLQLLAALGLGVVGTQS